MATSIQLYTDYRESRNSLDQSLVKVEDTSLPAIAVAMWKLDKEVMESILDGLLAQSGIVYAEVLDTYQNPVIQLGDRDVSNGLEQIYPISFTNTDGELIYIGELRISATLSEIYRQLFDKAIIILLTQGMKTFFMSICILMLVERLVIRHLNNLAGWANKADLANPEQLLQIPDRKDGEGDAIDKVYRAINTMQSNLHQALAERDKTERLIHAIIDNSPSLIYAKDLEGRYTMMNQQYLSAISTTGESGVGHTVSDLFAPETAQRLLEHDRLVAMKASPVVFDEEIKLKERTEYFMSAKFPIFDENNNLMGTGGVSTNITDRRQKEQQIIELNENLEQKVRERTEALEVSLRNLQDTQTQLIEAEKMSALGNVVTGVAHEINTPLGVSVTAASHLSELFKGFENEYTSGQLQRSSVENLISATTDAVEILQFNLNRAIDLIQNFKLVAVDQSSDMTRELELGEYVEEIARSLSPELKKGNHKVIVEPEQAIVLTTYPGALVQIFTNLIMNSIKHGFKEHRDGEIRVQLKMKNNRVFIDYLDNGSGLDSSQRDKVFEPFFTTTRGKGGSGLGMSICYNLVTKKLKGQISCVDSDHGAHFRFSFPLTS
ncbi:ATP-binding protein [Vibrio sp. JC009]|uniref:ATP-binding protein n=1 Tax=Vibrio sp. JC009 TaxID=2912314 RepID=UPI0023B12194|nr:ATP-binding protein [Vibrio sp. JC009]WED24598.1 ATP-binding protein [Vibrio sp. JC009]